MMKKLIKIISLLVMAVPFFASCEETGSSKVNGKLEITADRQIIRSDGTDAATIVVKLDDEVLTSGVTFYDGSNKEIELSDFKFTATVDGEYEIWASYLTFTTETLIITAVPTEVPATPADPQPDNTSFKRRVLLTQFTGAECGWCPMMKLLLKNTMSMDSIKDKVIKTDAHTFSTADPAYLPGFYSVSSWPNVIFDWAVSFDDYNAKPETVVGIINDRLAEKAKAGISANAKYADGVVTVKVVVKAAEAGNYRVGAWLIEDGIQGQQKDNAGVHEPWMNIFDDSIRLADSKVGRNNFTGHKLSHIPAGGTGEKMFVMNMKSSWKPENCKLVIFVTSEESTGYAVNNVIHCPIDGVVPFEYE